MPKLPKSAIVRRIPRKYDGVLAMIAEQGQPGWFVGDLDDPWVAAIADRLPNHVARRTCTGEIPESWLAEEPSPDLVVLHRPILSPLDIQRLVRLRARRETATKIVLCLGPHARYDDLVRWSRFFDAIVPDATASETIERWVSPQISRSTEPLPLVQVVSAIHDVRSMLADVCRSAGYLVERRDDSAVLPPNSLVICDCPVLEPGWADRLAARASSSHVIALLGFADRTNVSLAREAGVEACLEWPCEIDDLIHVLDRVGLQPKRTLRSVDPAHVLPPLPHLIRSRRFSELDKLG